jgi:hypothetical protein
MECTIDRRLGPTKHALKTGQIQCQITPDKYDAGKAAAVFDSNWGLLVDAEQRGQFFPWNVPRR